MKALLTNGALPNTLRNVNVNMMPNIPAPEAIPGLDTSSAFAFYRTCQPLLLAVRGKHAEVVDLLLKHGASATDDQYVSDDAVPASTGDSDPRPVMYINPTHYAIKRSTPAIAERLKQSLTRIMLLVVGFTDAKDGFIRNVAKLCPYEPLLQTNGMQARFQYLALLTPARRWSHLQQLQNCPQWQILYCDRRTKL